MAYKLFVKGTLLRTVLVIAILASTEGRLLLTCVAGALVDAERGKNERWEKKKGEGAKEIGKKRVGFSLLPFHSRPKLSLHKRIMVVIGLVVYKVKRPCIYKRK